MSVLEKSRINSEIERLKLEIAEYERLIDKARKRNLELYKESKIPEAICLSDLLSPRNNRIELSSKEDLNLKCSRCADLLIRYGRDKI